MSKRISERLVTSKSRSGHRSTLPNFRALQPEDQPQAAKPRLTLSQMDLESALDEIFDNDIEHKPQGLKNNDASKTRRRSERAAARRRRSSASGASRNSLESIEEGELRSRRGSLETNDITPSGKPKMLQTSLNGSGVEMVAERRTSNGEASHSHRAKPVRPGFGPSPERRESRRHSVKRPEGDREAPLDDSEQPVNPSSSGIHTSAQQRPRRSAVAEYIAILTGRDGREDRDGMWPTTEPKQEDKSSSSRSMSPVIPNRAPRPADHREPSLSSDVYSSPDSGSGRREQASKERVIPQYRKPSNESQEVREQRAGARRGSTEHRSIAESHSRKSQTEIQEYSDDLVTASTKYRELETERAEMVRECERKDQAIEALQNEIQELRAANAAMKKQLVETNEDIVDVCEALERSKKRSVEITEQLASRLLQLRVSSTS